MMTELGYDEFGAYGGDIGADIYSDVRRWRPATVGGHFLPLEEPELLAGELRAFFGELTGRGWRAVAGGECRRPGNREEANPRTAVQR